MKRTAALLAILAVAGCASLSEADCLTGDWQGIGYEDGALGRPAARVGDHREACARYGVAPNLDLWRIGYDQGLVTYCTRPSGFRAGVQGAEYYGVCPAESAQPFLTAYADGRRVFDVRQAAQNARNDLSSISDDIDRLRAHRDEAREAANDPALSKQERQGYLDDIADYSEQIGELANQREAIETAVRKYESDARYVEDTMRSLYPEWNGY